MSHLIAITHSSVPQTRNIQLNINSATKPEPASLPATPRNVLAAALLSVTGGMLDAIVWLLHGHVFASAMTGNTVLLAVSLLTHNTPQALRHLSPLITFTCGILVGWAILRRIPQQGRAHRIALTVQIVGLTAAGAAPRSFPSVLIVILVALTASVQIATFQRLDNIPYNSTFITGNIRTLLEAGFDRLTSSDKTKAHAQLRAIGPVCTGFLAGALLGAAVATRLGNHSLWIAAGILAAVYVLLHGG